MSQIGLWRNTASSVLPGVCSRRLQLQPWTPWSCNILDFCNISAYSLVKHTATLSECSLAALNSWHPSCSYLIHHGGRDHRVFALICRLLVRCYVDIQPILASKTTILGLKTPVSGMFNNRYQYDVLTRPQS
jgi:hypothetical protein